jgi:DNA (cytosine-5)-methyltransferase 1
MAATITRKSAWQSNRFPDLETVVGRSTWPTPSANKQTASGELTNADGSPWDGMSKPHSAKTSKPVQTALMDAVKTWPTPTCHNAKECDAPAEATLNTPTLTHQARGGDLTQPKHLNPVWVEWLMGWPLGWTDLKPLATDKFQAWRHSHGKCSALGHDCHPKSSL